MWSYTSKMFLSVYLSKMLIWDNQFLTKQADIFLQIHLIRDIHMKFNGGFCSNSRPGSPGYVLTFSFANQQRYACITLLQMNTEPGFKMFSKLTENIYLANTYFFFLFSLPIWTGYFYTHGLCKRYTNINNFEHVKQIFLAAQETEC